MAVNYGNISGCAISGDLKLSGYEPKIYFYNRKNDSELNEIEANIDNFNFYLLDNSYNNFHYDTNNFYTTYEAGHEIFVIDEANPSGHYTTLSANTDIYLISANIQTENLLYNSDIKLNDNDVIWSRDFPGDFYGINPGKIYNSYDSSNWAYYLIQNTNDILTISKKNPRGDDEDHDIKWRNTLGGIDDNFYRLNISKYYHYLTDLSTSGYLYPFYDDIIYDNNIVNLTDCDIEITATNINFDKWTSAIYNNRIKFSQITIDTENNNKTIYLSTPIKLNLINQYGKFYLSAEESKEIYTTLSGLNYKGPISTNENYWLDDWHCINTPGNVCPYIGKFAQGRIYQENGYINSPSTNIRTANIKEHISPNLYDIIGKSYKMNQNSQLGYYIGRFGWL